jgi:hypothetical protein
MKLRKLLLGVILFSITSSLCAQSVLDELSQAKIGGYVIGKASYTDEVSSVSDTNFGIRVVRFYIKGDIMKDWSYKVQMEYSGFPGTNKGVRLLDAYGEWHSCKALTVRFGQMKRVFSFENPFHPWNTGQDTYAQVIRKLTGFSDRVGEQTSGGRDLGLVLQGDFFPTQSGYLLHYQAGVYNGQGINKSDLNSSKDWIGGLIFTPIKDLQLGVFGWTGEYGDQANKVDRNRVAFGVNYESDWSVRAEYITSKGGVYLHPEYADKADGWYATVGIPVTSALKVYPRWDVYRHEKTWDTMSSNYGLTVNYVLHKHLMLQAGYYFRNAREVKYSSLGRRSVERRNSNNITAELYFRF